MVVYDPKDQDKIDEGLRTMFKYSRLITRPVVYQGKTYISVTSTDLDLLAWIFNLNPVNEEVKYL